MAAPLITITSISKTKISDEVGYDRCAVRFAADQKIKDFIVKAGGTDHTNGITVEKSMALYPSEILYPSATLYPVDYNLDSLGAVYPDANLYPGETLYPMDGDEQEIFIDNEELGIDGLYRINIYAMNEAGEWTAYE